MSVRTTSQQSENVSDIESVFDENEDDMDEDANLAELIDGITGESERDTEIVLANRQCNLSMDAILAYDFGGEEPKETLPPVGEKLALFATD